METRAWLDEWTREGERLIEEWATQSEEQTSELVALRDQVERLKQERVEMEDATSAYLTEIDRITLEIGRRLTDDGRVRGRLGPHAL